MGTHNILNSLYMYSPLWFGIGILNYRSYLNYRYNHVYIQLRNAINTNIIKIFKSIESNIHHNLYIDLFIKHTFAVNILYILYLFLNWYYNHHSLVANEIPKYSLKSVY